MNYFERELRKLLGNDATISDKRFVGRAFFGRLTDSLRVRVEFITMGVADNYDAIKATIINRNNGPVDSVTLRFSDLLGKKTVSNPNFKNGVTPYIWKYGEEIDWYVYKPNKADYDLISEAINDYLDVYREPKLEMEQFGQSENGLSMRGM